MVSKCIYLLFLFLFPIICTGALSQRDGQAHSNSFHLLYKVHKMAILASFECECIDDFVV